MFFSQLYSYRPLGRGNVKFARQDLIHCLLVSLVTTSLDALPLGYGRLVRAITLWLGKPWTLEICRECLLCHDQSLQRLASKPQRKKSIPDPSFSESIRNYMNLRQENKDLRNDKQWWQTLSVLSVNLFLKSDRYTHTSCLTQVDIKIIMHFYVSLCLPRFMLGLAALPSLIMFFGCLFLPESPRWLLSKGYGERAKAVLMKLRGASDVSSELEAMKNVVEEESSMDESKSIPVKC